MLLVQFKPVVFIYCFVFNASNDGTETFGLREAVPQCQYVYKQYRGVAGPIGPKVDLIHA